MELKPQVISEHVLREKYLRENERSAADIYRRVARALASVEADPLAWEPRFLAAMHGGFIPAGRILAAAGTELRATLMNCFVQPVGDSLTGRDANARPGIMVALQQAAETLRCGGGVGYNFSHIRPHGALVKGTDSAAGGPLSYLRIFDAMCRTVESAGVRRGAQMGILNCDHPDIAAFIDAKAKPYPDKELTQFNLSIGVSDAFMAAVVNDTDWTLIHEAEPGAGLKRNGAWRRDATRWVYATVRARELWERLMRSTYAFADPGVVFIDRLNGENNLGYTETIECTNPCSEQPLPDYGCCDLGSLNLVRFVRHPFTTRAAFDFAAMAALVPVAVRLLDNVLEVTHWPLQEQAAEAAAKRRIGLGFTGLGDALIMLGLKYDTQAARAMAAAIARRLRDAAYTASIELAREKGAFPRLEAERYLESGFARRLPAPIREGVRRYGIRNSHLLSIAPTGTLSIAFGDNCSSGIEPVFDLEHTRWVRQGDGTTRPYTVTDHAFRRYVAGRGDQDLPVAEVIQSLPPQWVVAHQIDALDHLRMVAAVAPFIDTAISKTINVAEDYPFQAFKDIYLETWRSGVKGITTYRPNRQVDAVLASSGPRRSHGRVCSGRHGQC